MARDILLLRLYAFCWRSRGGDEGVYRDLVTRYRAVAASLGVGGHMALAHAM